MNSVQTERPVVKKNLPAGGALAISLVYSFIILIVSLYNLGNLNQIYILHDEFGYWNNAAFLAGYDWSGISSMSPYYSFGYSIVLTPFFFFFSDPVNMYRAAIVLNALLYVFSFLLSVSCTKRLFRDLSFPFTATVCLLTALYCNNLIQVNMTWSEALLYFLFWLLIYSFIRYEETDSLPWLLLFAGGLAYIYVVHQRALSVVIAGIFSVIICKFISGKSTSRRNIIISAAVLLALFAIAILVKNFLQGSIWVWEDSSIASRNDYNGQIGKIIRIFTEFDSMKSFIVEFVGKFFYLFVASGFVIYWGIRKCICEIIQGVKERRIRVIYLFLLMSLIFTIGIGAVFFLDGGRLDIILYGRYTEFVVGPLLTLGFIHLYQECPKLRSFLFALVLFGVCGIIIRSSLNSAGDYIYAMAVGTSPFYTPDTREFHWLWCMAAAVILACIIYFAFRLKKKWTIFPAVFILLIYWLLCSRQVMNNGINYSQQYIENVPIITDAIRDTDDSVPIYFINNDDFGVENWRIEHVQYLLPEKRIQKIDYSDLDKLTGDHFLIHLGSAHIDMEQYDILTQAYGMVLMYPHDSELSQKCTEYKAAHPYLFADTMMQSQTGPDIHTPVSDHAEGFLTYCQYISLEAGEYTARYSLDISDAADPEAPLGYVDVCADTGQTILCSQEIFLSDFEDPSNALLDYSFSCDETIDGIEIRFYSYGNARIELRELSLSENP